MNSRFYSILMLPALALAACSSAEKPRAVRMSSVPGTMLPSSRMESVRYAENIKEYPLGRYIDPNDAHVMHEAHPIYRVESTAKWNLHPNAPVRVPMGPAVALVDPAEKPAPTNDEIRLEMQRQKAITKEMTDQQDRLNAYIGQLHNAVDKTKSVAAQNVELKTELQQTKARLQEMETKNTSNQAIAQQQTTAEQQKRATEQWDKW